jgi:S-adenosylhomocysteine hydrolase
VQGLANMKSALFDNMHGTYQRMLDVVQVATECLLDDDLRTCAQVNVA